MNNHRSRRTILRILAAAAGCCGVTPFVSLADGQCSSQSDNTTWVGESLKRMLTIKPGMTRSELMKVFTTEGGISTALQRTFVSRDCPYFKANVKFWRAAASGADGNRSDWLEEFDDDVITNISEPFLQFSIMD